MFNRLSALSRAAIAVIAVALFAIPAAYVVASPGHLLRPAHIRTAVPTQPIAAVPNSVWVTSPSGTLVQVQYANVSIATAATHSSIVAATAGKTILVLGYDFSPNVAAGSFTFETSTANGIIGGPYTTNAIATVYAPFTPQGYFKNTAGDALQGTVTGTSNTIIVGVRYILY